MNRQVVYTCIALGCVAALYSEFFNQPPGPSWEERHGHGEAETSDSQETPEQMTGPQGKATPTATSEPDPQGHAVTTGDGDAADAQVAGEEEGTDYLARFQSRELSAYLATKGEPLFDYLIESWDGESAFIEHPDYELKVIQSDQQANAIGITLKPELQTGEPIDTGFLSATMQEARQLDDGSGADRELALLELAGDVQLNELTCISSRCTFSLDHSEQAERLIGKLNDMDSLTFNVFYGVGENPNAVVDLNFIDSTK